MGARNVKVPVKVPAELQRHQPSCSGIVRRADRCLAARLYDRRVPLDLLELALRLAATRRRQLRPPNALPLTTIRSLHYFLPILDELSNPRIDPDYLGYLRYRLTPLPSTRPDGLPTHRKARTYCHRLA